MSAGQRQAGAGHEIIHYHVAPVKLKIIPNMSGYISGQYWKAHLAEALVYVHLAHKLHTLPRPSEVFFV